MFSPLNYWQLARANCIQWDMPADGRNYVASAFTLAAATQPRVEV